MSSRITLSVIISTLLAAFVLSSCADKEAEAEISRLAKENAELSKTVDSLQKNLDSLTAYGDSVKKSLEKLDMHP
jgi:peptidoglycan hydrolase CwlO-like protein